LRLYSRRSKRLWQRMLSIRLRLLPLAIVIVTLLLASVYFPAPLFIATSYSMTVLYTIWGAYHLLLVLIGVKKPLDPPPKPSRYPKISVIIPARDEPLLGRVIETVLKHVEYPDNMKEVIIVTDDPHGERVAFWYQQKFHGNVKLLARRELFPTKPSALNDGFYLSSGEIVAIMDVEDIPDRDTFLKVVSALVDYGYDAVQVILRIVNEDDSWITKMFAVEYAAWFRVWINGRSKLGHYTPLGGTGNYFKRSSAMLVGMWDSLNLAEDAEVAARMHIAGKRTVLINARHWEEAPVDFRSWLRQRTRWYRGWLQILWKYGGMLRRLRMIRKLGIINFLTFLLMFLNPLIVVFNIMLYWMTLLWLLEYFGFLPKVISDVVPVFMFLPALLNIVYYSTWIIGAKLERVRIGKLRNIPQILLYVNVMLPVAALRALYQALTKPVFWEKTTHPGRGVKGFVKEKH